MTVTHPREIIAVKALRPEPTAAALKTLTQRSGLDPHRQQLLDQAAELNRLARVAAERGDLPGSGRSILEALDCERRAGGLGPQVLQLIKPRP